MPTWVYICPECGEEYHCKTEKDVYCDWAECEYNDRLELERIDH